MKPKIKFSLFKLVNIGCDALVSVEENFQWACFYCQTSSTSKNFLHTCVVFSHNVVQCKVKKGEFTKNCPLAEMAYNKYFVGLILT